MACFLVSAAEAVVVTAIKKHEESVEKTEQKKSDAIKEAKVPLSRKLKWLT